MTYARHPRVVRDAAPQLPQERPRQPVHAAPEVDLLLRAHGAQALDHAHHAALEHAAEAEERRGCVQVPV